MSPLEFLLWLLAGESRVKRFVVAGVLLGCALLLIKQGRN